MLEAMRAPVVGFAMCALVAASDIARADTVTLVCRIDSSVVVETQPTTVELNEAQSAVVVNFAPNRYTVGPGELHAAWGFGPVQATFSDNVIAFSGGNVPSNVRHYEINRTTGVFLDKDINWHWTCAPGKKQF